MQLKTENAFTYHDATKTTSATCTGGGFDLSLASIGQQRREEEVASVFHVQNMACGVEVEVVSRQHSFMYFILPK